MPAGLPTRPASAVVSSPSLSHAPTPSSPATSFQPDPGPELDAYARVYTPAWLRNIAQAPLPLYAGLPTAARPPDAAEIARHAVPAALLERWADADAELSRRINASAMREAAGRASLGPITYASHFLHALRDEHIAMTALAASATLYGVPLSRRPAWNVTDSGSVVLYQLVARSSRENVPPIDLGDSVIVRWTRRGFSDPAAHAAQSGDVQLRSVPLRGVGLGLVSRQCALARSPLWLTVSGHHRPSL